MTYEQFVSSFFKALKEGDSCDPMSREQFNEMLRVDDTRERRRVDATLDNHIKVAHIQKVTAKTPYIPKLKKEKTVKTPKPRYKPPKIYTDEELKQRRKEARQRKRAENKELGLTIDGKQRKILA